jgi:hypothetical protein
MVAHYAVSVFAHAMLSMDAPVMFVVESNSGKML